MPHEAQSDEQTEQLLSLVVDPVWYRARHRDVAASGADPLRHFIATGLHERRDPNRWFDGAWYVRQYADVAAAGAHPLLHYMAEGARQRRDPHPRFDAAWYSHRHPEADGNPLLFHLRVGAQRGWLTERPVAIEAWLPSARPPLLAPASVPVDVVVPVYRGLEITRRCLDSVLADTERPTGRIIVIDDRSPERELGAWLDRLAAQGTITLLRNKRNLGFVASVNLGMQHAGDHDVALLNSDTEVPSGWLRRLQAQACAGEKIASVSPLSNNASICSYLGYEGGPMPAGIALAEIDAACRTVNAGRYADAPTTVGFCMYIRRAALDAVGLFDVATFGRGYGEENDFCLRASALGWRHHIACDTFVQHEGGVSFGADADTGISRAYALLTERYPEYALRIAEFVDAAETEPCRFAITMALFRASGLPTILVVSHQLDGGVRRHVHDIVQRDAGRANYLVLEPASRGVVVSVPALPGLPKLVLAAERWRDVAAVARSAGVTRVHIHHLMGLDLDVRALIFELAVKFDVTLHDYFAICPQVTLLPWSAGRYCGEPGPAGCDACIAHRPSHGATDILSWRLLWAWQFQEAERVFVPSRDALERLQRHGLGERAVLAPHEAVTRGPWPICPPLKPAKRLRVTVLGALANHKGAHLVASVAMAADPARLELQVIGDVEADFPAAARQRITIHGRYQEGELASLMAKYRPHAIWFPASWPETYSFTLSAAISAGLPIVAGDIGAFTERLAGRPLTWLIPPTHDPAVWLALFDRVAETIRKQRKPVRDAPMRRVVTGPPPPVRSRVRRRGPIDLRRSGTTSVLVIPEAYDDETNRAAWTPCAHIRLLRPLHHPVTGRGLATTITDAAGASRYHADVVITQRHAVKSIAAAKGLVDHARRTDAPLIFDLDDDLLSIPPEHPEADDLASKAAVVEYLVRQADIVRTSTAALAARIAPLARQVQVAANALDERIWLAGLQRRADRYDGVGITGYASHHDADADFDLLLPALTEIHRQFGDQIRFDLIGFVSDSAVPPWIRRLAPTPHAGRSYAGFVHWLRSAGAWDIGLAPLAQLPFSACKSAIKVLDHAALGLASVASDVPAYQGSPADGAGGILVPNTSDAWYEALSRMIRDTAWRCHLATCGTARLLASGTLEHQAGAWPEPMRRKPD